MNSNFREILTILNLLLFTEFGIRCTYNKINVILSGYRWYKFHIISIIFLLKPL